MIEVPSGKVLPCDLILLTGSAIVNEAMLTGESIPVMKSSLPYNLQEVYSETNTNKHTLFSGTTVIQTRPVGDEKVFGLVSRCHWFLCNITYNDQIRITSIFIN